VGGAVLLVAMVFTEIRIHSPAVTALVFVLTSVLFSLGGFVNAVYANSFDDISIVPTFVLTPLTYLGGVFYSIDLLPPIWQAASLANPILYLVNGFRWGLTGVSDIPLGIAFAVALLFIVALALYSLRLLKLGVGVKT
jgi:ABC-2 type transport system permease protein